MTPRLIAIDLDGTVIAPGRFHGPASDATQAALDAARKAGVPVVVVTARTLVDSRRAVAALGLGPGPHVYTEGAIVTDKRGRVVHRAEMEPAAAIEGYLRTPGATFALERDAEGWVTCLDYPQAYDTVWLGRASHDELGRTPGTVLGVRVGCDGTYGEADLCPHSEAATALAELDPARYRAHVGRNGWTAVVAAGNDKATGLARAAAELGVDASGVIAFGDSLNDLPMIEWAGIGVAMGQGREELKAVAQEVAPSIDEDGVAAVLRRWFS